MNRNGVMGSPRSATAASSRMGVENRRRWGRVAGRCHSRRFSASSKRESAVSFRPKQELPRKALFVALPSRRVRRCCVCHANAASRALPLDPAGARPCADPQTIGAKDAAVSSEVRCAPMSQAQRVARGRPLTRPAFQPRELRCSDPAAIGR